MSLDKETNTYQIVQADVNKCIELIENLFPFLKKNETITDIQYNGDSLYAQDNKIGRYKLEQEVSKDNIFQLIKKIANYSLKPFSTTDPILDVAFGNYRLSAMHPSLARVKNEKVTTFSLRVISPTLKIKNNDISLCPFCVHNLLSILVKNYQSIIISGLTGSGKTELQKYLVSKINDEDRIIIIEESYETYLKELYPKKDITTWISSAQNTDNLANLIKTALRHNPDWIIVAESRGNEVFEIINSISTGHPMITTIHCDSAESSLNRIIKMFKKDIEFDEKSMLNDIASNLKIGIHIQKYKLNNQIVRKINEIVEYIPAKNGYSFNTIFKLNEDLSVFYGKISNNLIKELKISFKEYSNIKVFIKEENYETKRNK